MNIIQHIDIPKNISEFLNAYDGCNLSINLNNADRLNGYGHIMLCSVHLSMITRTCNRCGYDPLWHPDRDECNRHTYEDFRYDEVFFWRTVVKEDSIDTSSLERAFDIWLKANPKLYVQSVKLMMFKEDKKL